MSSSNKDKEKEKDPETDITWFLINCIMHSEAGRLGKIDWDVIAKKLNIKTKDAAYCRYKRMLKSYGLTSTFTPKGTAAEGPAPAGYMAASEPPTPVKKRKSNKRKRQDPKPEPEDAEDESKDEAENVEEAGEEE